MARARGSYPRCRGFESPSRYFADSLLYAQTFQQKFFLIEYGEIAQLARARGSYPRCRGFESPSRYFADSLLYAQTFQQKFFLIEYGEIAQLARARGSYPRCRGFESPSRYYRCCELQHLFFCFIIRACLKKALTYKLYL